METPTDKSAEEGDNEPQFGHGMEKAELEAPKDELKAAEGELKAAEGKLKAAEGKLKAAKDELKAAKDELKAAEGKLKAAKDSGDDEEIAGAKQDVTVARAGVAAAQSGVAAAQSGVTAAQSGVTTAQSGVTAAQSGVTAAQSGVTAAQKYYNRLLLSQPSADENKVLKWLSKQLLQFLNSPSLAAEPFTSVLRQFLHCIAPNVTCEDVVVKAAVTQILERLEFEVVAGDLADSHNYMEADPSAQRIHVNRDWLCRAANVEGVERRRHECLLLQKGLHEIAHLLTPKFVDFCEERKPPKKKRPRGTPTKIGTKGRGRKRQGDAGYCLEQELSGGRMFHEAGDLPWIIDKLLLQKLEKSTRTLHRIPDTYCKPKSSLDDFKVKRARKVDWSKAARKRRKGSLYGVGLPDTCLRTAHGGRVFMPADIAEGRKA